jgi:ubiquinol-cytochrome c reductase iron-sulfur subunit
VAISQTDETTRRDFIYVATGGAAAVGTAFALWPFIDQMNPSASVLALASTEIDLGAIQPGQSITVLWRGAPTFIRRRTPAEIQAAATVPVGQLIDGNARNANLPPDAPATDSNRVMKPEWLIVIGICTHLGCIPLAFQGNYRGWLCPCHGSQYDTAGRVRVGPAPENLAVPPYTFVSDTRVRIG